MLSIGLRSLKFNACTCIASKILLLEKLTFLLFLWWKFAQRAYILASLCHEIQAQFTDLKELKMLIQWLVSCWANVEGLTPKDLQSNQAINNL